MRTLLMLVQHTTTMLWLSDRFSSAFRYLCWAGAKLTANGQLGRSVIWRADPLIHFSTNPNTSVLWLCLAKGFKKELIRTGRTLGMSSKKVLFKPLYTSKKKIRQSSDILQPSKRFLTWKYYWSHPWTTVTAACSALSENWWATGPRAISLTMLWFYNRIYIWIRIVGHISWNLWGTDFVCLARFYINLS